MRLLKREEEEALQKEREKQKLARYGKAPPKCGHYDKYWFTGSCAADEPSHWSCPDCGERWTG